MTTTAKVHSLQNRDSIHGQQNGICWFSSDSLKLIQARFILEQKWILTEEE